MQSGALLLIASGPSGDGWAEGSWSLPSLSPKAKALQPLAGLAGDSDLG